MAVITDKQMQAKATGKDQWLTQPFKRGAGVFVGRITPTGERTFYFRYTDTAGRRPFLPIGPYSPRGIGGLTLTAAFKRASEWSLLYQSGVRDLREHFERLDADRLAAEEAEKQRLADEQRQRDEAAAAKARRLTVQQLFEQWRRAELAPQLRADGTRTGRKDGGRWVQESFERRVFPSLGSRHADELTRADLLAVIDAAKAEGKLRTAQVLMTDLRQMLRFATEREIVAHSPLEGLKLTRVTGRSVERERVLDDAEVGLLLNELIPAARLHPRTAAAISVILSTGVRAGELTGAVWADTLPSPPMLRQRRIDELRAIADANDVKFGVVDITTRRWHLHGTKNGRDHEIHLSAFATAQFHALAGLRETCPDGAVSPWVFPATDATRPVCVKSLGKQLADRQREPERRLSGRTRATHALALPGGRWTLHDLRRSAATMMARLGVSTDVIDECLNHKLQSKVARIYIRDRRRADQARAFDELGKDLARLSDASAGTEEHRAATPYGLDA